MTIEIHKPELEALIRERMDSGAFENIEDVLLQSLKSTPAPTLRKPKKNLAQFLLNSPLSGSELKIERQMDFPMPNPERF